MGNFRDNRSGGGRSFGRRSFDGDRSSDRQMFKTTCSNCSKECEVPFQPSGRKPVYCNDCFRTMGGSDSRRTDDRSSRRSNFDNGGRGSSQPQYREQFEMLNVKLDKILKLLSSDASQKQSKKAQKPVVKEVTALSESFEVEPEISQLPDEEKMIEEVQLQPEIPTIIPEKKKKIRKITPDITPVE